MIEVRFPDERRPPITPQLALRVAILGGIALVMFAVVFLRLWYLQVLSGDQYVIQANDNRLRVVAIPAPRGEILDRAGRVIVSNLPAAAVQVAPDQLPPPGPRRQRLYRRLGAVLQMSPERIQGIVAQQLKLVPYANVTVKTDAGQAALDYLAERQQQFPGVLPAQVFLRRYPYHNVGAQLVGTVGQISPPELKLPRFRGVKQGAIVGKNGLEWSYDRYLRGRDGLKRLEVDALGRAKGQLAAIPPIGGRNLRLSLDLHLQKAGQKAVMDGINQAQANGHPSQAGAFVALDPRNGAVLALGSAPSFDPNIFTKPITQAQYAKLSSQRTGAPLFDRAIEGLYPTGSTFKPFTALAALESGIITPDTPLNSPPCITIGGAGQQFCSAGKAGYGTLALRQALQVSSDVFFYQLGEFANARGAIIQTWAHRLGLGQQTGIDLPGEQGGLIPDRAWRDRVAARERACEARRHVRSCGISDGRPWSVGDNVNLSVGQGDVQATPLQMAVAYSTIMNGGTVVRPHLGLEVDDSQGRLIQKIDPPPARHVQFNGSYRQAIMDGLRLAASAAGGTSADVFAGFPHVVYGKTGTAQHTGADDQSWYVCYSPGDSKHGPIVVAMTIEKGGFGAEAAAPAVREMLAAWYGDRGSQFVTGHSRTL